MRNRQMFFGGLPLNNDRATLLVERKAGPGGAGAGLSMLPPKAKRFSTEAFLDLYLQEQSKPLATFDQVQQQMALEKETQGQLKEVLGIRTFDQIQADLSKRMQTQSKLQDKTETVVTSTMNP